MPGSFMYDAGREGWLGGDVDWDADTIQVILIDSGAYTANQATHDFLDDIPSGARPVTAQTLSGKTKTGGVADANDVTFPNVSGTNPTFEAVVFYKSTGVEATSRLLLYIDSTNATGLPITPNGGDITLVFDNGTNKIFKL